MIGRLGDSRMRGVGKTHTAASDLNAVSESTDGYDLSDVEVTLDVAAGRLTVLAGLDLNIAAGQITTVVGHSGTGKTTLLRLLAGLQMPTRGSVHLGGSAVNGPPDGVITVFQDYENALLPWRTVFKNVALGLEATTNRRERLQRTEEALELVGLSSRADDYPWRLSGGMQQRVQIARSIAMRPRVLLMDEPFGALDAMTRASLQDELISLQQQIGATVVFITHDLDEAIYISDRVLVIAGQPGVIRYDADVSLRHPRDQVLTREDPTYLRIRHELSEVLRDRR